ncbi:MAG: tRNA (adenine(22)-N(1))-methyltransferase TrmK [Candidatus Heimdallarchaeota archaeon]|nr:tRNA (adenine(22)-N(1))-methyltransferase TrmK [Candidatus Heimdallarchaeota archaeon]
MSIHPLINKKCGVPVVKALKICPELLNYLISPNRLDLGNTQALLLYNQLVLQELIGLKFSVPKGYLIPTICSRWEFIKFVLDKFKRSPTISVLEIGTGASAILAMILCRLELTVIATEINEGAYKSALANIKQNNLSEKVVLLKSEGEIITNLIHDLSSVSAIICNPPQYNEKYYQDHHDSPRGFSGEYSELVGGDFGHEFIMKLLAEVNQFSHPPPVFFQLTLPKLQAKLEEDLIKEKYCFSVDQKKIGTRLRLYYRIDFTNKPDS